MAQRRQRKVQAFNIVFDYPDGKLLMTPRKRV